jgi:hypothetical protein
LAATEAAMNQWEDAYSRKRLSSDRLRKQRGYWGRTQGGQW